MCHKVHIFFYFRKTKEGMTDTNYNTPNALQGLQVQIVCKQIKFRTLLALNHTFVCFATWKKALFLGGRGGEVKTWNFRPSFNKWYSKMYLSLYCHQATLSLRSEEKRVKIFWNPPNSWLVEHRKRNKKFNFFLALKMIVDQFGCCFQVVRYFGAH